MELDRGDCSSMQLELVQHFAGRQVPKLDHMIFRSRNDPPPVRTESNRVDDVLVPFVCLDAPFPPNIPHLSRESAAITGSLVTRFGVDVQEKAGAHAKYVCS